MKEFIKSDTDVILQDTIFTIRYDLETNIYEFYDII
jgi:hypothetical protein